MTPTANPLSVSLFDPAPLLRDVTLRARVADGERFADTLASRLDDGDGVKSDARKAAEEFVAIALVQPLLSQLREHHLVDEEDMGPFAPGRAEETFGPQWDAQIARRIVTASNYPLVDELARRLAEYSMPAQVGQRMHEVDVHG